MPAPGEPRTGRTGVKFPKFPGKFSGNEKAKSFPKTREGEKVEEFPVFP